MIGNDRGIATKYCCKHSAYEGISPNYILNFWQEAKKRRCKTYRFLLLAFEAKLNIGAKSLSYGVFTPHGWHLLYLFLIKNLLCQQKINF